MTSNGKQFTVTHKMLAAVAHDQSVQLKMAWCCCRNLSSFFYICFCFVLLYNKSLVLGNIEILGKHWDSRETKIHCPFWDQSLSVNCRNDNFYLDIVFLQKLRKKTWVILTRVEPFTFLSTKVKCWAYMSKTPWDNGSDVFLKYEHFCCYLFEVKAPVDVTFKVFFSTESRATVTVVLLYC